MTADALVPQGEAPGRQRRRRRRIRVVVVVAVLALLVLAFFGGGGWYFAGQIRSDGLAVSAGTPEYPLVVVSTGPGSVALREAPGGARDDRLRGSFVYGLRWAGGSGILGPVRASGADGSVVRPLKLQAGAGPSAGTRAELRTEVYDDPATAYGVRFREVTYPCVAGRCPAWFVPGTGGTWAVMVHGKGATRTEPLRALGAVLRVGMPALVIGYRNDAGAPRDPSGFYRYGQTEWRDLDNAVAYALGHGAARVVLFGFSMGGGIVASFLQHSARVDRVPAVVLDAPMLNFRRTVGYAASQRRLPLLGTPIPGPLTWSAETIAGWRFGIDWAQIDYSDARWLHVPALVFHGTADDTVPISTSDALAARYPTLVREVRLPGVGHVESWNAGPARYTATVSAFLAGYAKHR